MFSSLTGSGHGFFNFSREGSRNLPLWLVPPDFTAQHLRDKIYKKRFEYRPQRWQPMIMRYPSGVCYNRYLMAIDVILFLPGILGSYMSPLAIWQSSKIMEVP